MSLIYTETRDRVDREISRLEGGAFRWLALPSSLEEEFEVTTARTRVRRIWVEGVLCLGLYNSFLLSDFLLDRSHFTRFLLVRLVLATPAAFAGLRTLRRAPSRWARESIIFGISAILSLSTLFLYVGLDNVVSSYAITELLLILLFTNVGMRLRLPFALGYSGVCLAAGALFLSFARSLTVSEKAESVVVLASGVALSLIANYSIERGERLNFLLRQRSEVQSEELAEANHHLRQISNEDRLTSISNRRHFEEIYKLVWEQSLARTSSVSLIMIDIDNFKLLNDRYGHTYGDAVLRRVATLLGEGLRVRGDFVARYGGEEFVVVLPNSSLEIARVVAERIRKLVEIAGSPATDPDPSSQHGWSTVSCGVATAWPHPGLRREELIGLADEALYQAKAEGRNKVCCAVEIAAPLLTAASSRR